jgi:peptidyl-prolyl cis-trans isomerase D
MAPAVAERAFELKDGEVSEAIRTPQGFAFVAVTGKQDSYVPKLDEVKAKVRDEVLKKKAGDVAKQKAVTIGAQMKSGDFNAAAKAAGLDVKTTEFIARGAPIGDVGVSPAVDAVAFAMQPNAVSDPITTDNGTVIVKVLERQDPPASDIASGKASVKTEMVNERRNRFYASYMTKARERMRVNINRELIAQLVA